MKIYQLYPMKDILNENFELLYKPIRKRLIYLNNDCSQI
jgi:hypothetical protein